jgi:hypothetical protein
MIKNNLFAPMDGEDFDKYWSRINSSCKHQLTELVAKQWFFEHWPDVMRYWAPLNPHNWSYELRKFSSSELMKIDHVDNELELLDQAGSKLYSNYRQGDYRLTDYILENETFPVPIIVAFNASHIKHPWSKRDSFMKAPYQLIEGHRRLAFVREVIKRGKALEVLHEVFLASPVL